MYVLAVYLWTCVRPVSLYLFMCVSVCECVCVCVCVGMRVDWIFDQVYSLLG